MTIIHSNIITNKNINVQLLKKKKKKKIKKKKKKKKKKKTLKKKKKKCSDKTLKMTIYSIYFFLLKINNKKKIKIINR